MGDREPLGAMDAYRWATALGKAGRFNEFPWGPHGPSILELRDGSNECKHGRCPFDKTPPCGCFDGVEKGELVTLPARKPRSKSKRKRKAA